MLIIEIPKSDKELIIAVKNTFENCEEIEVDSLSTDTIVQILVPMITVGIPAVSAIIVQILKNRKATVNMIGLKLVEHQKISQRCLNR